MPLSIAKVVLPPQKTVPGKFPLVSAEHVTPLNKDRAGRSPCAQGGECVEPVEREKSIVPALRSPLLALGRSGQTSLGVLG